MSTAVEQFWGAFTVFGGPFSSASDSLAYLEQRSSAYPLFHELMELWGRHDDQVILDYGCGPGNDMVGFLAYTKARSVIGMDVSPRALGLAYGRMALHDFGPERWRLVKVSDAKPVIPLETGSVDFIYSEGVLHHASHPAQIVAEFHRVLRVGGQASIMVYNYNSLWVHRWVAYDRRLVRGIDADLPFLEAFRRSTDGTACPISRPYRPDEFVTMCRNAGFDVAFRGGYFSDLELGLDLSRGAPTDPCLEPEHRAFLNALTKGPVGPLYNGLPAGIGGTYRLVR